jgi:ring-1,2-phenylacetyl-CoA epoxidase subunit PaaD
VVSTPTTLSLESLWDAISRVLDPEVPALSVVDLGIVRDVRITDDAVEVDITPTYSGCPAMKMIEDEIVGALTRLGVGNVRVKMVFQPAWTTDWISEDARQRLRAYGIAPPGRVEEPDGLVSLRRRTERVTCPFCGSQQTSVRSDFGSTACKSLHYCDACHQPFERFKAI